MRPYEAYLTMQKQANMLTHGLWKGTALGAVPGALAGGAAGYNMSEDHPYLAAAGGALAGGLVGGAAGRYAHAASRDARLHSAARHIAGEATPEASVNLAALRLHPEMAHMSDADLRNHLANTYHREMVTTFEAMKPEQHRASLPSFNAAVDWFRKAAE
jgi:hypothetical protein